MTERFTVPAPEFFHATRINVLRELARSPVVHIIIAWTLGTAFGAALMKAFGT